MVVATNGAMSHTMLRPPLPIQKRVLYIGSSVPVETSEGLEAIQKPLRDRFPIDDDDEIVGIDSMLTVLPYGLQLQYIGDDDTVIWFPISSLTLCAAVRCIHVVNGATGLNAPNFVSLSSPAAGGKNSSRPAIFTAITRRTTGRRVLECHGFVCSTSGDAIDLVQSTKYADAKFDKKHAAAPLPSAVNPAAVEDSGTIVSPPFQQPVKLQTANEDGATVTPELNGVPPRDGYFYSCGNNLVKRFTLSRLFKNIAPLQTHSLPRDVPVRINQHLRGPHGHHRHVHPSFVPRMVIPYGARPGVRPVYVGPPPLIQSRHKDPHVFQPPAPVYINAPFSYRYQQQPRNRSMSAGSNTRVKMRHSYSSDSSMVASNDRSKYKPFIRGHDSSSDDAPERCPTPPADYDTGVVPTTRLSRRDQYERTTRQGVNDSGNIILRQFRHPHPLYDTGNWNHDYPRTKSLPPFASRKTPTKDKKPKAKRKNKHRAGKYRNESSDSIGYVSEMPPTPGQQLNSRDPAWFGNHYGNEKAFSQSLMRESRWGHFPDGPTAYSINQPVFDRSQDIELTMDY